MHEVLERCESKMTKTLANLDQELGSIRAGRANPHVLDHIMVDYYGAPTPIQQTANISVPEPRVIQIAPWDKNMVAEINKALQTSDLGPLLPQAGSNLSNAWHALWPHGQPVPTICHIWPWLLELLQALPV